MGRFKSNRTGDCFPVIEGVRGGECGRKPGSVPECALLTVQAFKSNRTKERDRRLHPRECEGPQGWGGGWEDSGVSNTQTCLHPDVFARRKRGRFKARGSLAGGTLGAPVSTRQM